MDLLLLDILHRTLLVEKSNCATITFVLDSTKGKMPFETIATFSIV